LFGRTEAVLLDGRDEVMCLVEEEGNQSRYARNADANENQASLAEVETIERWIDQGEDLEERVVDAWKISSVSVKRLVLGVMTDRM
jgi:hypothetical protein